MHILIAGCGWLGSAVAAGLLARGDRVTGVRRDPGRAEALRPLGIAPLALDLADPASAARLPGDLDAILAMPSSRDPSVAAFTATYLQVASNLLEVAARQGVRALVYTGSTGVFGQRDGGEVDEDTPPAPGSPTAQVLAAAERAWLDGARQGLPARVVRLSGLYGPGRAWMVARVRAGALALGPGDQAWLNSCHRDDAVAMVLAALDRGRDGQVYHATDAEPMRRREVVLHVASALGIPPPVASGKQPRQGPDRRISGARSRAALGVRLQWPSLREGLAPLLALELDG